MNLTAAQEVDALAWFADRELGLRTCDRDRAYDLAPDLYNAGIMGLIGELDSCGPASAMAPRRGAIAVGTRG